MEDLELLECLDQKKSPDRKRSKGITTITITLEKRIAIGAEAMSPIYGETYYACLNQEGSVMFLVEDPDDFCDALYPYMEHLFPSNETFRVKILNLDKRYVFMEYYNGSDATIFFDCNPLDDMLFLAVIKCFAIAMKKDKGQKEEDS